MDENRQLGSWFDPTDPIRFHQMQNWIGADKPVVPGDRAFSFSKSTNQISKKSFFCVAVPFVVIGLGTIAYQFATMLMG